MRDLNFPFSKPKRVLLEVAERLFAERGFENVSVRDITQLAKANVAAVNYHFGSREGLIGLVMTRYISPVNEERIARLDKLERQHPGKVVPLEELIDALMRPLLTSTRKSELSEQLFYRLVGRIFSKQGEGMPEDLEAQFQVLNTRFISAFGKALPELSTEELIWRLQFMVGSLIHILVNQELIQRLAQGKAGTPGMEATLARLIRYSAAGMRNGLEGTQVSGDKRSSPQATFDF